jgi:hypothetical protein
VVWQYGGVTNIFSSLFANRLQFLPTNKAEQ